MSLRLDKDVETYLLKSRSDDNERMSCNRQTLTFIKKIIYATFPFFNFYKNQCQGRLFKLQTITQFSVKKEYSSTKSILITGNTTRAVLVKLQCLHHQS
jgi:hypothetical protein